MSLRFRLTLTYGVLLVIALAAFGFASYLIAASRIYQGVDDTLDARAKLVTTTLQPLSGSLSAEAVEANRAELEEGESPNAVVQLRQPNGEIIYTSARSSLTLPVARHQSSEPTFVSRKVQGSRMRILYQPLLQGGQLLGTIEVGQSLKDTDAALDEIRNVFLAGGLAVCVAGVVLVYVLSGRALSPVRQVSQLARDVERTADFSQRLPAEGTGGETKELITTFNAMIVRVEKTLTGQLAFLADSSHELRRPLTVLRTNIDVLREPGLSPEDREACLTEMRAEAESMSRLLSDLLLLSRDKKQAIARTLVDYTALCEQAAARFRAKDENRHELSTDLAREVRVMGDGERLAQMLWNVLENAMNYTPSGGRIDLILIEADGIARLEVKDTGIGIGMQDLPYVFERFYRGTAARSMHSGGSGLGLAIARYVAEAHGGGLTLSSRWNEGTVVVAELQAT